MWLYDKKLQFPVKIKKPDPKMAKVIITQYGGPDGELAASLRYLSQRFTMVTPEAKATLNDIGTEEMAHLEMVGSMVKQLTENASIEEIKKAGMDPYYADHDRAVYPVSAAGVPFTAAYIQSKGDPMTDLYEDMAAEQKARSTYEYLLNLASDPDVIEPLKFLRQREIVHFQRFGESLRLVQEYLENKKRFSMSKAIMPKTLPKLEKTNAPNRGDMPVMKMEPNVRMPAVPGTRPIERGMPNVGEMPDMRRMPENIMPDMRRPNIGEMPDMRRMPENIMPETRRMPENIMPDMRRPNVGEMPDMRRMPENIMPETRDMKKPNVGPAIRDMQNVPGTPLMPNRRIQTPRDMTTAPRRQ